MFAIPSNRSQIIGQGGFGIVYLEEIEGKKLAVKKIKLNKNLTDKEKEEILTNFENEAKIMLSLNHENIVRIRGYENITYRIYMNYERGGDLFSLLKSKKYLSPNFKIHIFKGICNGLQYLHSKFIIHGDLKPKNILLEFCYSENAIFPKAKISDFGLSDTRENIVKGYTCFYSAPEVKNGKCTIRSDIYSLGQMILVCFSDEFNNNFNNKNINTINNNSDNDHLASEDTKPPIEKEVFVQSVNYEWILVLKWLYCRCTRTEPKERPNIDVIKNIFDNLSFDDGNKNKKILLDLAIDDYEHMRYLEAQTLLKTLIIHTNKYDRNSNYLYSLITYAKCCLQMGPNYYDEAFKYLSEAENIDGHNEDVILGFAEYFNKKLNKEYRLKAIDKALKYHPNSLKSLLEKANYLFDNGSYFEYFQLSEKILSTYSLDTKNYLKLKFNQAHCFLKVNYYDEAQIILERIEENYKENPEFLKLKALYLEERNKYLQAIDCINKAIKLDYDNENYYNYIKFRLYDKSNQFLRLVDEAKYLIDKLKKDDEFYSLNDILIFISDANLHLDNVQSSKELLKLFCNKVRYEFVPQKYKFYFALLKVKILIYEGNYAQAEQLVNEYLSEVPGNLDFIELKIIIESKKNNDYEPIYCYEKYKDMIDLYNNTKEKKIGFYNKLVKQYEQGKVGKLFQMKREAYKIAEQRKKNFNNGKLQNRSSDVKNHMNLTQSPIKIEKKFTKEKIHKNYDINDSTITDLDTVSVEQLLKELHDEIYIDTAEDSFPEAIHDTLSNKKELKGSKLDIMLSNHWIK